MLLGLRHPALVGRDDEQRGRHRPDPGEHVADEPLVAGHVDEARRCVPSARSVQAKPRSMVRPRRRSSAQRSGSMPVSARTRVDLPWSTCPAVATTCCISRSGLRARCRGRAPLPARPSPTSSSRCGGTHRRSSSSRPCSTRPTTGRPAGAQRRGERRRARRRPSRAAGRRALRRRRPPRRPRTTSAATPASCRRRGERAARRARRSSRVGVQRVAGRRVGADAASPPGRRASACRPAAHGPAGWRRSRSTRSAAPSSRPACGPPSSLSPLAVTRSAPSAQRGRRVGLVRQRRVRREQAGADVDDEGHRRGRPGRARRPTT